MRVARVIVFEGVGKENAGAHQAHNQTCSAPAYGGLTTTGPDAEQQRANQEIEAARTSKVFAVNNCARHAATCPPGSGHQRRVIFR